MSQPTITVSRHYLDWPLNQTINQNDLLQQLGVHATGSNGQDLTSKVIINLTQVNINQVGEYPLMLSVMDADGQSSQDSVTLNVRVMANQEPASHQPATPATTPTDQKSKKGWLWLILALLIILGVWWAINNRNRQADQAANNNEQSSQISNNSSSINKLSEDNQKLANQVAQLKGATQQYQKDHDQQALQERLDTIQNQNQQLQNQVQDNGVKQDFNQVNDTINEIQQNPDDGTQIVNNLKNEGDFAEIWSNVSQQVQKWLSEFANADN
jgi:cbb3-type cytochrome oxidase subunit 3/Txe/YoeB family toxin of Txe-Axe toxin-antitoxin module